MDEHVICVKNVLLNH